MKLLRWLIPLLLIASPAVAQWQVPDHAVPIGRGVGQQGFKSALCTSAQLLVGQAAADPLCKTITGDVTISAAGATAIGATKVTSAMLNADVFSTAHTWSATQTLTINQNTATNWSVTNNSAGVSANASYSATNGTGTAAFGIGGTGYTDFTFLQNRAYAFATTASDGIAIATQGADPIFFIVNSTEVGRWDSAVPGKLIHGVAGTTVGQACFGNATSGTVCIVPATGALGSAVATLPAGTYNIVGDSLTQTLTNKNITCSNNTCNVRIANDVSGLGTGVATALAANIGSAGAPVTFNGAGGTPSSLTLTNATGLPTTGLTGTLQAAQEPAHTGDCTNSAGSLALTCTGINGVNQNAAFSTYAPTISCNAGTITTLGTVTGRSQATGKKVFVYVSIPITTIGSCTGFVQATLPTAAANTVNQSAVGRDNGLTGKSLGARIVLNTTSLQLTIYDGTGPGASGATLDASAFYEIP